MNTKTVKPYCKVCQDAGKSESEYTSHFVKSEPGPNGIVVCPTLLGQSCRFCSKKGHTPKECPALKAKEQAVKSKAPEKKCAEKVPQKKPSNLFASLSFSDSEDEKKPKKKMKVSSIKPVEQKQMPVPVKKEEPKGDFPALSSVRKTPKDVFPAMRVAVDTKISAANMLTGYAEMAAKIAPKVEAKEYKTPTKEMKVTQEPKNIMQIYKEKKMEFKSKNWADWSDSDEEDEVTTMPKMIKNNYVGHLETSYDCDMDDFMDDIWCH
jgi:hypothetical protein